MPVCVCVSECPQSFSHVGFVVTPWAVGHQAPLSMKFHRQEYSCGLPFPPPGNLPDPGVQPASAESPALPEDSLPIELSAIGKPYAWGKARTN